MRRVRHLALVQRFLELGTFPSAVESRPTGAVPPRHLGRSTIETSCCGAWDVASATVASAVAVRAAKQFRTGTSIEAWARKLHHNMTALRLLHDYKYEQCNYF